MDTPTALAAIETLLQKKNSDRKSYVDSLAQIDADIANFNAMKDALVQSDTKLNLALDTLAANNVALPTESEAITP